MRARAITLGPDTNIWFTEFGTGKIGMISTSTHFITEFPLAAGRVSLGIASGSDGNLWYTEYNLQGISDPQIGRMSVGGVILNEYPVPSGNSMSKPDVIIAGPDQDLWFHFWSVCPLGKLCDTIGKITTTGLADTVYEYDDLREVYFLTVGADHAIWFTGGPAGLGRLTDAGVFTSVSPASLGTGEIAKGPDGNIWYTDGCSSGTGQCIERLRLALGNLSFSPSPVNEGNSSSLTGMITDFSTSNAHTVVVDWGDGSENTSDPINGPSGTFAFGPIDHTYLNNQVGTSSSTFTVNVTVTNDQNGSGAGVVQQTVNNVAPQISNVPLSLPVSTGGVATLSGNVADPGSQDTETLSITWGDASPVQKVDLSPGSSGFNVNHQYVSSGTYQVIVTDLDDDNATSTATATATVPNLPPPSMTLSATNLTFPLQLEGSPSEPQPLTVTNSGDGPLLIADITTSGDYSQTNNCGMPISAGDSCSIQVVFTPQVLGADNGTLTIASNTPGSPQEISLSGTGVAANLALQVPRGGSSSATVSAGQTASYTLSIGGLGMSGTATLSCTGAPSGASCSLPASVPVSGSTASTFAVSVTTTSRGSAVLAPAGSRLEWIWAMGIVAVVLLPGVSRRKQWPAVKLSVLPFALLILVCACGGGSNSNSNPSGTPAGSYPLTVTATMGTDVESTRLTLKVQ